MPKAKRFYWIKLKENFFSDKTIKKLRRIAGGDTYTIIYLKLVLLSTATDGKLYYDGLEDSFCEELALSIDEDVENVKMTIMYLLKTNLIIEINPQEMEISRFKELVGSETEKAELMRKKREKDKLLENKSVTMLPNVTQTLPYIEKEKNKEKDIYLEKEKNIKKEIDKEIECEEEKKEEETDVEYRKYLSYKAELDLIEKKKRELMQTDNLYKRLLNN